jgi:NADH-quinone oxidoreductase subunit L
MGGLKKDLPITYWTFLIGAIAIAGVPGLAGFFSKDAILYRTYASGHTIRWVVGLLTSLLTAIYMFRLVFMAFHGERRVAHAAAPAHPEEEEPAAHHAPGTAHDAHHGTVAPGTVAPHGGRDAHGHHLHDAPPAMAIALIVLAIGSVVAGYAGVPKVLGGSDAWGHYLEPSFTVQGAPAEGPGSPERVSAGAEPAQETESAEASEGTEMGLMGVSIAVAFGGIGLAAFLFLKRRDVAAEIAAKFPGVRRLLMNKYYVDEIYDGAIVQPIKIVSEEGLWKIVDVKVIDGAVNGVGDVVRGSSEGLRRIQTGSVRAYAASVFLGVVTILGYYLWR